MAQNQDIQGLQYKGMRNVLTPGVSVTPRFPSEQESHLFVPSDADHTMIGRVESYSEDTGIMRVKSVWDIGNTQTFFVLARLKGKQGKPSANEIEIGQLIDFHRVGDFNSNPTIEPVNGQELELREQNVNKVSFVSFFFDRPTEIPQPQLCFGPKPLQREAPVLNLQTSVNSSQGFSKLIGLFRITRADFLSSGGAVVKSLVAGDIYGPVAGQFGELTTVNFDCDQVRQDRAVYRFNLVGGKLDGQNVLVIHSISSMDYKAICCEEDAQCPPVVTAEIFGFDDGFSQQNFGLKEVVNVPILSDVEPCSWRKEEQVSGILQVTTITFNANINRWTFQRGLLEAKKDGGAGSFLGLYEVTQSPPSGPLAGAQEIIIKV